MEGQEEKGLEGKWGLWVYEAHLGCFPQTLGTSVSLWPVTHPTPQVVLPKSVPALQPQWLESEHLNPALTASSCWDLRSSEGVFESQIHIRKLFGKWLMLRSCL